MRLKWVEIVSETLVYEGLTFELQRKRTSSIRLRIYPTGRMLISAPTYTSKKEIDIFLRNHLEWIRFKRKEVLSSPMAYAETANKEEQNQWKEIIQSCVPPLVEEWASILGVTVTTLAYRNMKSRWGSCQPSTGRVCINTRLALYPPECLEYVVVHELCHFLEPNHGKEFHALMTKVMPDWKARRAKLQ